MQQRRSAGMTRRRLLLSGGGGVAVTLFLPELSAFADAGRAVAELTEFPTKQVEARDMTAYIIGLRRSAPRGTEWARNISRRRPPWSQSTAAKRSFELKSGATPRLGFLSWLKHFTTTLAMLR